MKNQRKAGILLSYLQTGLGIVISLAYTPVMLRLLGQSEYGVYQTAASVISYLSLLSLGFGSSYMRFFARYKAAEDKDGIRRLSSLFMLVFGSAAIISLLAGGVLTSMPDVVFGNKFTENELAVSQKLLAIMTANMALSFFDMPFSMYVNAHERFIFQKILNIISTVFGPMVTLPLLIAGYGSVAMTLVTTLVRVGTFIANIVYSKKLGIEFSLAKPDKALLKEISVFSFFIFLTSIALHIDSTIDVLLLSRYVGSDSVAIYEIGSKFNGYLMTFSVTISSVFIPKINIMIAEKKSDAELTDLMIRIGRIQFYVISLIFLGFVLIGRYFIGVYAGEEYSDAYFISILIMGGAFVPYMQNIGIEIQKAKNKHIFRSVAYLVIAIANIGISIPFIRTFGTSGAAVGTAIATLLGNTVIMNIYYKKGIGMEMERFWKALVRPIIASAAPFSVCFVLTKFFPVDRLSRFIIFGAAFVVLFALSEWLFALNKEEKQLVLNFTNKLKRKKTS